MKIIVWLWNPWKEYEKTRHNAGFLFLDYLKEKNNFSDFSYETKNQEVNKQVISVLKQEEKWVDFSILEERWNNELKQEVKEIKN